MPSFRHTASTLYVGKFKRFEYPGTDVALGNEIASRRTGEHPEPPRRIRKRVRTHTVDGFAVHVYRPSQIRSDTRMVYLHGGAYVNDMTSAHWRFIARIGDRHGIEVVVPRYPLAPEATWKQSRAALIDLVVDAQNRQIIVAGDSAGGGLALALAQRAVERGAPPEFVDRTLG